MSTRSADATILGYRYQFDYSIMKILEQGNNTKQIELEGLEDIDITNDDFIHLYQCKYYSKTEYNHSEIKDAIIAMFKHFLNNQDKNYKYYLYGHFQKGTDKYKDTFQILKDSFLSKKEDSTKQLKLVVEASDEVICAFQQKLNIKIDGISFEEQEKQILEKFKSHFPNQNMDDDFFYYLYLSNARNIIHEICSKSDNRIITKKELLEKLQKTRCIIHNNILIGIDVNKYKKEIKKEIAKLLRSRGTTNNYPATRFIILDIPNEELEAYGIPNFCCKILEQLHNKFSSPKSPNSARRQNLDCFYPYFILPKFSPENLKKIKLYLYKTNHFILDDVPFLGAEYLFENMVSLKFNNDLFRPFRILKNIENIKTISSEIQKNKSEQQDLAQIQYINFYRDKNGINTLFDLEYANFHIQQKSIEMLEEMLQEIIP